ncbi:MAG: hypothetical protein PHF51_04245 [Candidatus ainarchaeum sp.]|nr:hypothetical protein [Candidatus ainarchaeum sp.]
MAAVKKGGAPNFGDVVREISRLEGLAAGAAAAEAGAPAPSPLFDAGAPVASFAFTGGDPTEAWGRLLSEALAIEQRTERREPRPLLRDRGPGASDSQDKQSNVLSRMPGISGLRPIQMFSGSSGRAPEKAGQSGPVPGRALAPEERKKKSADEPAQPLPGGEGGEGTGAEKGAADSDNGGRVAEQASEVTLMHERLSRVLAESPKGGRAKGGEAQEPRGADSRNGSATLYGLLSPTRGAGESRQAPRKGGGGQAGAKEDSAAQGIEALKRELAENVRKRQEEAARKRGAKPGPGSGEKAGDAAVGARMKKLQELGKAGKGREQSGG